MIKYLSAVQITLLRGIIADDINEQNWHSYFKEEYKSF